MKIVSQIVKMRLATQKAPRLKRTDGLLTNPLIF